MLCEPWATEADIVCGPCAEIYDIDDMEPFLLLASETLYNFTEGAYPGLCTDTIRPPSTCTCGWWGPRGNWPVWGDTFPLRSCRCSHVSEIVLPGWPAREITEVVVNGVVIAPARYRIDNHRKLVFQPDFATPGAPRAWPHTQRGDRPSTEQGTWAVTYTYGTEPTAGGIAAAVILACEYAMACLPGFEDRCRLPRNTVSLTKKNVAVAMVDPTTLNDDGLTGIPEVDGWIRSDRWGRAHRGATVYTGNQAATRRRTSS